jgi:repressor LexA
VGGAALLLIQPYTRDSNLFALKIKGDSMKDAAILDGDLVICEPRQFAENGEIVVVLIHL